MNTSEMVDRIETERLVLFPYTQENLSLVNASRSEIRNFSNFLFNFLAFCTKIWYIFWLERNPNAEKERFYNGKPGKNP